jgi:pseudaminic acid cytidylyltransferase
MNLCIIPARAGSKRIKKKNIKVFCGKPIIAWSIELAIASKFFDKVIVSTDDLEIAKISKKYGALIPFIRPSLLADDYSDTVSVISHAVKWQTNNDQKPLYVCCIYATAPFLKLSDLRLGLKLLKTSGSDYTFSATSYNHPIQRSFKIKKNNRLQISYPENYRSRTQDLDKTYHDVGQFYWGSADSWIRKKQLISNNSSPVIIPRSRAIDIDTIEDWKMAEKLFEIINIKR